MRVLLAEDDLDLLDVTTYALRRQGVDVITATDGAHAVRVWENERPDAVVLDVDLPRLNGLEVCRAIRRQGPTPIVMLSDSRASELVARSFRLGADDFVAKPFDATELALRLQAIWSRRAGRQDAAPARALNLGPLLLDAEAHEVRWSTEEMRGQPPEADDPMGAPVRTSSALALAASDATRAAPMARPPGGTAGTPADAHVTRLTPIQFRLLYLLGMNAGRVVSTPRLLEYGWGYGGSDASVLKTHISQIRRRLDLAFPGVAAISSIPCVGYRLTLAPPARSLVSTAA
jgi:DNA-binding response OmpR family regulator